MTARMRGDRLAARDAGAAVVEWYHSGGRAASGAERRGIGRTLRATRDARPGCWRPPCVRRAAAATEGRRSGARSRPLPAHRRDRRSSVIKPSLAALVAAAVLAPAPAARAQEAAGTGTNAREYGLDAGVRFGFGGLNSTIIALPAQSFRVGFYRSPTVSIEPYGAFNYRKVDEGDGTTQLALGTGLLYHFANDRRASAYVRPFAELSYLNAGDASDTQFTLGGGLGLKRPWSDRFAWRLEGNLGYTLEAGNLPGGLSLGLSAGMSFFTF